MLLKAYSMPLQYTLSLFWKVAREQVITKRVETAFWQLNL